MKNFLAVLLVSIMTAASAAESIATNKFESAEKQCIDAHLRVDALLQFLYKFEGNLPPLKPSKEKNLKFLISKFKDFSLSKSARQAAFTELFNDADYYQLELQEKSLQLIKGLEELKQKSSPSIDRSMIVALPKVSGFGDYENPYSKLRQFTRLQNDIRDFFETLDSSKNKLEQLNQLKILSKSLDNDAYSLSFKVAMHKGSLINLIECNLSYMEAARISK
jgi:hypothetical protein